MPRIEIEQECAACHGTGLYVGMAEKGGAAVVCSRCKGFGHATFTHEYQIFTGRKKRPDVLRVLQCNPGIVVDASPCFGGLPAEEWAPGMKFPEGSEVREHTCPAWFYQMANYDRKPDWEECRGVGLFASCPHFGRKDKCWERFDREQKGASE